MRQSFAGRRKNAWAPPRLPLRYLDDDWEDEDDEEALPSPEQLLLSALSNIETLRAGMQQASASLQQLLDDYPELQRRWQEFQSVGGISAQEFRYFLAGGIIRAKPARRWRHLRLVASKRKRPTVLGISLGRRKSSEVSVGNT
jgi:hypothetical protein